MPRTSKPIVLICGSRSISDLSIGRYINPKEVGQVVHGGDIGVDTLTEQWAKNNNIESIIFPPNYEVYGKRAPLVRDKEMVEYADLVIAFYDGQSHGTKYVIDYCKDIGRKCIVHLIEEWY